MVSKRKKGQREGSGGIQLTWHGQVQMELAGQTCQ